MKNFAHRSFILFSYLSDAHRLGIVLKKSTYFRCMAGRRSVQQLEADQLFLQDTDRIFQGDRKRAAESRVARAWNYFNANVSDTAMMRFNQAWLLDSANADVYWGFGNLLGSQEKFKESIPFFEKSLRLNPENPMVWEAAAQSYGNIYTDTHSRKDLDSSIYYLRQSFKLDPKSIGTISKLTMAYLYAMQKDSATNYMKLAESLTPMMPGTSFQI